MKKTILTLAITTLIAGTIFTSCQSATQKEENAENKVEAAEQNLKEAKQAVITEEQKAANTEEWKIFRNESEVKIKNNKIRIDELKVKIKKSGNKMDKVYEEKIVMLEQKNHDLNVKMDTYEKSLSDWESFKRELNHDMDEIGDALKELTVDNKK